MQGPRSGTFKGGTLIMLLGRGGSGGLGGSGGSQAAVARCRGDKLETGLERGVGYRSSVVRIARSYAGRLCCSASSADHTDMSGGMWGARLPESAATLSPMATAPIASLEADPSTSEADFGDALGRAVWGGLVLLSIFERSRPNVRTCRRLGWFVYPPSGRQQTQPCAYRRSLSTARHDDTI